MKILIFLDIVGLGALFAALLFLGLAWRRAFRRSHQALLMVAIALLAAIAAGNVLRWTEISPALDSFEGPFEIMALALLGMFFYSFQQHAREAQLKEREEWYMRLFNNTSDAIYVHGFLRDGRPGQFREVNEAACRMLGYSREELLDMGPVDIDDERSVTDQIQVSNRILESGHATFERLHVAKDGRRIPVELSSHIFVHEGRQSVLSIARDVSQRKETERRAREVQILDEKILEASPVVFLLSDRELRVLRASPSLEKITGMPPESVLGKTPFDIIQDQNYADGIKERHARAMEENRVIGPNDFELPGPRPLFVRETIVPVPSPEGGMEMFLVVLEDITNLKMTEKDLRYYRELDQKILDNSPIALVLQDRDMRLLRVSKAYQKVTGFVPSRVVGKTMMEFMPEGPSRDGIIERVGNVGRTGQVSGPFDFTSPLGRDLREIIVPIQGEEGIVTNTLSILEDLGERRSLEDKARRSEKRFQILFNAIQDGVIVHESPDKGPPGLIIEANEQMSRMTGYSFEELQRMRPTDVGEPLSPEMLGETGRLLREGKALVFERTVVTKDGRRIPVENRAIRFELDGRPVVLAVLRDVSGRDRSSGTSAHPSEEK